MVDSFLGTNNIATGNRGEFVFSISFFKASTSIISELGIRKALWEVPIHVTSVQTSNKFHFVGMEGYANTVLSDSDAKKTIGAGKFFHISHLLKIVCLFYLLNDFPDTLKYGTVLYLS